MGRVLLLINDAAELLLKGGVRFFSFLDRKEHEAYLKRQDKRYKKRK